MWFFRWWLATKAFPQPGSAQAYGLSLVCVRECFFKSLFVVKSREQPLSPQLNVFPKQTYNVKCFCLVHLLSHSPSDWTPTINMVIGELATCVNSFMCSQPIEGREGCFARREALANKRLLFRVYPAQARIAILMLMLLLKFLVTVMILMVSSWFGPSRQHLGLCPWLRLPCVKFVWTFVHDCDYLVWTRRAYEERNAFLQFSTSHWNLNIQDRQNLTIFKIIPSALPELSSVNFLVGAQVARSAVSPRASRPHTSVTLNLSSDWSSLYIPFCP